jgi:hypothetical protein
MPTDYPSSMRPVISGVGVMEFSAKMGGQSPSVFYGLAYLDAAGNTMGQVRSNYISEEAAKLLQTFLTQVEKDFIEVSSSALYGEGDLEEDGLNYPDPDSP